jgi:hypothetical protein
VTRGAPAVPPLATAALTAKSMTNSNDAVTTTLKIKFFLRMVVNLLCSLCMVDCFPWFRKKRIVAYSPASPPSMVGGLLAQRMTVYSPARRRLRRTGLRSGLIIYTQPAAGWMTRPGDWSAG